MSKLVSQFFGPLDKSSCVYFLVISGIFFMGLVFIILTELYFIATNYRRINLRTLTSGVIIMFNIFIAYFVNRLLYSMCNKSLA